MKTSTTLLLLVLTAVLGSYIAFVERFQPSTEEAARDRMRFMEIRGSEVQQLSLTGATLEGAKASGGVNWTLVKREDRWYITEPIEDLADFQAVSSILSHLDFVKASRVIEDSPDRYGLTDPAGRLLLKTSSGENYEVLIGSRDSFGKSVYCSRSDAPGKIWILPVMLADLVLKGAEQMRNHTVMPLGTEGLESLEIASNGQRRKFSRRESRWFLNEPYKDYGDPLVIDYLLKKIEKAGMVSFLDPGQTLNTFGQSVEVLVGRSSGQNSRFIFYLPEERKEKVAVRYFPLRDSGDGSGQKVFFALTDIPGSEFPGDLDSYANAHPAIFDLRETDSLTFTYPNGESLEIVRREGDGFTVRGRCEMIPDMKRLSAFWNRLHTSSAQEWIALHEQDARGVRAGGDYLLRVGYVAGKFSDTIELGVARGLSNSLYCRCLGRDRVMALSGDLAVHLPFPEDLVLPLICKMSRSDITELRVEDRGADPFIASLVWKNKSWVSAESGNSLAEFDQEKINSLALALQFLAAEERYQIPENGEQSPETLRAFQITGRMETGDFLIGSEKRVFDLCRNTAGDFLVFFEGKYYRVNSEASDRLFTPLR